MRVYRLARQNPHLISDEDHRVHRRRVYIASIGWSDGTQRERRRRHQPGRGPARWWGRRWWRPRPPDPIPTGGGGIVGLIVTVLAVLVGGGFGVNAITRRRGARPTTARSSRSVTRPTSCPQLDCRNALYVNSIQAYWQASAAGELRRAVPAGTDGLLRPGGQHRLRRGRLRRGAVLLPRRPQGLHRPDLLPGARRPARRQGRVRPALRAGPRVRPPRAGRCSAPRPTCAAQQERDPDNANALSVKLELQADCYAGAWAKNATETADAGGDPIFKSITDAGHQGGPGHRGRDRRRRHPEEVRRRRQPGRVHPRHVGAAPAVVPHRLRDRRPEGVQHVRVVNLPAPPVSRWRRAGCRRRARCPGRR